MVIDTDLRPREFFSVYPIAIRGAAFPWLNSILSTPQFEISTPHRFSAVWMISSAMLDSGVALERIQTTTF